MWWVTSSIIVGLVVPAVLVLQYGFSPAGALLTTFPGRAMAGAFAVLSLTDLFVQWVLARFPHKGPGGQAAESTGQGRTIQDRAMILHALAFTPALVSLILTAMTHSQSLVAPDYVTGGPVDWLELLLVGLSIAGHLHASILSAALPVSSEGT